MVNVAPTLKVQFPLESVLHESMLALFVVRFPTDSPVAILLADTAKLAVLFGVPPLKVTDPAEAVPACTVALLVVTDPEGLTVTEAGVEDTATFPKCTGLVLAVKA
jgi:hypothetical protein